MKKSTNNYSAIRSIENLRSVRLITVFFVATIFLFASVVSAEGKSEEHRPKILGGERALEVLGEFLPDVAAEHAMSEKKLRELFETDDSLFLSESGQLLYIDKPHEQEIELTEEVEEGGSIELAPTSEEAFSLHSLPSASKFIFLDFDGHITSGTHWNSEFTNGATIHSPPYDTDNNSSSFSTTELAAIVAIWKRVAEDFSPFNVDVTTEEPSAGDLSKSGSIDTRYGIRVVIGGSSSDWLGISAGGVAWIGSFDWSSDTPVFAFENDLASGSIKAVAEAVSHEVGHSGSLNHDGIEGGSSYYSGHGSGDTSWAPIMGVGYNKKLSQWSKGEYANASNLQDDYAVMASKGIIFRSDDFGSSIASASQLSGTSFSVAGIIERPIDIDYFKISASAGNLTLSASPLVPGGNVDLKLSVLNSAGNLIASSNPISLVTADLDVSLPSQGTYYIAIEGVGKGDPLGTGYTDYGSTGQYFLTGSFSGEDINQAPTAVAQVSSKSNLTVAFSSAGSSDSDGSIVSYLWNFGDGSSSTNANPSHTYATAGNYNVSLSVTDNEGANDSDSLSVSVSEPVNQAPNAVASADKTSGPAPLTVSFSSAGSSDSDGSIVSFHWNFGDGSSSNSANPSHTFSTPDTYTVILTVTDNQGEQDSAMVNINVEQAANEAPNAVASANKTSGPAPLTVSFSSAGSSDSDGNIVSHNWNFGDGTTSSSANPSHTFSDPKTYTVVLTVTDDQGSSDSDSLSITVGAPPTGINAPTGLSATVSGNSVSLSWVDNSSGESGYRIRRGIESGHGKNKTVSWSTIATLGENSRSYLDSGLSSGKYFYTVEAFNSQDSARSSEITVNIGSKGKKGGGRGNRK